MCMIVRSYDPSTGEYKDVELDMTRSIKEQNNIEDEEESR